MGVRKTDLTRERVLAAAGGIAAASVLAAGVLATLAIASSGSELWRTPFRLICHGQVDRAFDFAGTAMPICARCTGIYFGIAVSAVALFAFPLRRRDWKWLLSGLVIAAPLVIDGVGQLFGFWSTGNEARALSGLLFGTGLILIAGNGLASADDGSGRERLPGAA